MASKFKVNLLSPDFIIGSLSFKPQTHGIVIGFTLWYLKLAMENASCIDDFPTKHGDY